MTVAATLNPIRLRGKNSVKEFYTVAEIAKLFSVTSKTITVWIEAGKLPGAVKLSQKKNAPFIVPASSVKALAIAEGKELPKDD